VTVTAAVAASDVAFADSQAKITQEVTGSGRAAGIASGQLLALAKANASAAGTSIGQAQALESALLQTGKVGGGVFGDLIAIQKRYAIATSQDLKQAQAELAAGFADPAKGAQLLEDRLGGLDGATQRSIQTLLAQGRTFEAQKVLAKAYADALTGVNTTSQTLGGQFSILGNAISDVSTRFGEAVNTARAFIELGPKAVAEIRRQQEEAAKDAAGRTQANKASLAGTDLFYRLDPDAAAKRALQGNVSVAAQGLGATALSGDLTGAFQTAQALDRATRAEQSYIPAAEKAHQLALLEIEANRLQAQTQSAATRARLGDIAARRTQIELAGQPLTRAEVAQRTADARAVAASNQAQAPQDTSKEAIQAAQKEALAAQLALTKDVEKIAALKHQEVADELAAAEARTARLAKDRSISGPAAEIVVAEYRKAAISKDELIEREKQNALAQQQLAQRAAIGGYLEQAASGQAALAQTAEQQNAIELEALARRQELERDTLDEKLKEQVQSHDITEADADQLRAALGLAQAVDARRTLEAERVRVVHQTAQQEQEGLQNRVQVMAAQADLLKSDFARRVVNNKILELEQQIELSKANEAVEAAPQGSLERQLAEARREALKQAQSAQKKVAEQQTRLVDALHSAARDASDFGNAFKSHDFARALDDLMATIETIKKATESYGPAGGLAVGAQAIGNAIGGKAGKALGDAGNAAATTLFLTGNPALAAAAAAIAGLADLLKGKPTNAGAGYDLVTGQISGNKRTSETEQAATQTGKAILQGEDALRSLGADLKTTIQGVVLGTRDPSQIYTSTGKTLTSPVGDAAAAAEAALKEVLRGATFTDQAEQKLVQSLLDAGKGFDDITTALQSYTAAQAIPQQIDDAILKLTDPKASALADLKKQQEAFRDSLKAAADAGNLTADDFAKDSAKLDVLEKLQTDKVLEQFTNAVGDATDAMKAAQALPQQIEDEILRLTDPTAAALKDLRSQQTAFRDSLKAAADAGNLTAEDFAKASGRLDLLEQLQASQLKDQLKSDAGNLQTSVADQILQLTNPNGYQIKKINDDIDAQIAKAQPLISAGVLGGEVIGQLEELRGLQLQNLFASLAANVDSASKAFAEARPRLLEWLDAQTTGPNSGLSPKAQLAAAQSAYQRQLALAQGGDANALGSITSYADTLKSADRAATSSATDRLARASQVDADIAALAARGVTSPAATTQAAIAALQQPLGTIAQAAQADLAAEAAGGKAVVIANLPSIQAIYGEALTAQTDRLVAANDRSAAEIVAAVADLAGQLKTTMGELGGQLNGALGVVANSAADQAAQLQAALAELAEQQRLADARSRAAG
jgi:hypothetical protein